MGETMRRPTRQAANAASSSMPKPTSMLFRSGHRLRVEISSSNFPRFDRNPNTGGDIARETKPIAVTQTLFLGSDTPSRLILPIVPR